MFYWIWNLKFLFNYLNFFPKNLYLDVYFNLRDALHYLLIVNLCFNHYAIYHFIRLFI